MISSLNYSRMACPAEDREVIRSSDDAKIGAVCDCGNRDSGRKCVSNGIFRRVGFKDRVVIYFQPRMALQQTLVFLPHAEHNSGRDTLKRQVAVKDGRAFPANR